MKKPRFTLSFSINDFSIGLFGDSKVNNEQSRYRLPSPRFGITLLGAVLTCCSSAAMAGTHDNLTLAQAIDIALANNIEKNISQQSVEIAQAQYRQAMSARWPTFTALGSFQRRDEALTYQMGEMNVELGQLSPALSAALGGAAVPSSLSVPGQEYKLADRDLAIAKLEVMYPIYTGGKISSVINQASLGKAITQEEARRTNLQVERDVKRYYYASQLTIAMHENAKETAGMLENLSDLTKSMYENGSESVNKLDYLKTKMAFSYAQSAEQDFHTKHQSALAALSNAMGLDWNSQLSIGDPLEVANTKALELQKLIDQANELNPQLGMLELAIQVADAKIAEAKSAYHPQIALFGNAQHIDNSFDGGITNDTNRDSWTLGIGIKLSLFDGGLKKNRVSQAKLERMQMQEKQNLAKQGLATMLKNLFIELDGANMQVQVARETNEVADEHVDLSARAFDIGASTPDEMIQSQLLAAILKGQLYKAQHDQLLKIAEIEYVLGARLNP